MQESNDINVNSYMSFVVCRTTREVILVQSMPGWTGVFCGRDLYERWRRVTLFVDFSMTLSCFFNTFPSHSHIIILFLDMLLLDGLSRSLEAKTDEVTVPNNLIIVATFKVKVC